MLKGTVMVVRKHPGGGPPRGVKSIILETQLKLNSELSFIEKDLGFVQTRDQELLIALFKSIKLQLSRKLDLVYIFPRF